MGRSNKKECFSWAKRLARQVVQRILDTVLWPSPVTAHWVACEQNLCQTWEWTFSAPWDKMVMKCPPQNHGQVYEQKGALPTENWHLPSDTGRAVLLGSLTLLLSTRVPLPSEISCFVNTCVSSDTSFPSVRQEPGFGPWKWSPFLQQICKLVYGFIRIESTFYSKVF